MGRFRHYQNRIDELTLRERVIIFSCILLVLFLGWYSYLLEPLIKEGNSLQANLESRRSSLQEVSDQFTRLTDRQGRDPDAENRARIAGLRQQSAEVDRELAASTAFLIPPEEMPGILREVLNNTRGLTLQRLSGLGSTPLALEAEPGAAREEDPGAAASIYRHGMRIEFTGGFPETVEFIQALEQLKRGFFWDEIDYQVAEYPLAKVGITLYTLSLTGEWIRI